jgi:uncharacterized protein
VKKIEQKKHSSSLKGAYWDTSAIVPLCCFQNATTKARQLMRMHGKQVVWWATSTEIISALQRLMRDGHISQQESAKSYAWFTYLRNCWNEIQPSDQVRTQAEQLLRMHRLRAADALQLSAALSWCNNYPRDRVFIAADGALLDAAQIEGFTVLCL